MRPWLHARSLEQLNELAEAGGIRTESGRPVRFTPPSASDPYYEIALYETGHVATRPGSLHDWFNALAWLAFPLTKARINAMHAAAIALEGRKRGRLRDLLTLFDEGGAIVAGADPRLEGLLRGHRWKALFWDHRAAVRESLRFLVLGHAVLEKSLDPWPGITCKALFVPSADTADARAAAWLSALDAGATPRELAALPVYGYPGWLAENARPEFYDEARFFRGPRA